MLNGSDAKPYVDAIPWIDIECQMTKDAAANKSVNNPAKGQKRQSPDKFSDYGFCGNESTSRLGSGTGHAKPNLKSNSKIDSIVKGFLALSEVAQNVHPTWRLSKSYVDVLGNDYLREFASNIHPNNVFPSLHIAKTSVSDPCGCHNDSLTNSKVRVFFFFVQ